jgi:hypothetical protein
MTTNVAASVRARLTTLAQSRKETVDRVFLRYAIERLLARMAASPYCNTFILKGAMLFAVWADRPFRSTGDLDLLGSGDPDPTLITGVFSSICTTSIDDDGVIFDPASVTVTPMREEEQYPGVTVAIIAKLAGARLHVHIDIGFGDAVTPPAALIAYPTLLKGPAPHIRAYPPQTVVAEKLEAMASLGMRNSRLKDFYDMWVISQVMTFTGGSLVDAITATFRRRQTALSEVPPIALSAAFANDVDKQRQWAGFLRRTEFSIEPAPFQRVHEEIVRFVMPPLTAAARGEAFDLVWNEPEAGWSTP